MPLKIYNSYSKKEEEFVPQKKGKVSMYTCGPTVYGRPHIGNYSSFLMADLLRRWLEVSGYTVTHVKNITDVGHLVADADEGEDKIEKQAKEEKVDPLAIAKKYTDQYLEDEKALNMIEPEHRPRATETIAEMIGIIQTLIKNGNAYETDDGVYFDVQTFPQYGELSGNTLEHLNAGARVAVDENKRHPADFALWKKTVGDNAHHILKWPSPWGDGFPGWHIECSAMSRKFLGMTVDIHTGGEDNIFPHHECEIAQSECSGSHPFVHYWLHKRRIEIDTGKGESKENSTKMSKSLGNTITIPAVLSRGFDALDLRHLMLSVHYRTRLKFSWQALEDAKKSRLRIVDWMEEMNAVTDSAPDAEADPQSPAAVLLYRFREAMDSDLNVSEALAAVFEMMAWSRTQKSLSDAEKNVIRTFTGIVRRTFGSFEGSRTVHDIPADIQALFHEREKARKAKDFARSDALRAELQAKGYAIEDTPTGARVVRK